MFHNGKQVDIMGAPAWPCGSLTAVLKGKRRSRLGNVRRTPSSTTPFGEDEFGAWCTLAGRPRMRRRSPRSWLRARARQGSRRFSSSALYRSKPKATAAPTGTTFASPVGRRLPLPQVLSRAVAAVSRRVGHGTVGHPVQRHGALVYRLHEFLGSRPWIACAARIPEFNTYVPIHPSKTSPTQPPAELNTTTAIKPRERCRPPVRRADRVVAPVFDTRARALTACSVQLRPTSGCQSMAKAISVRLR
jgi:hypothetical protein